LFAGLTITLVSVAIGVAVMRLPSDESGPRSGRRQRLAPTGLPQARKPAFATVRPKP